MGLFLTLLVSVALQVIADLLRPKQEQLKPAGLGDIRAPTATEARPIPMLWGTVRLEGPNVVWYGDLIQEAITERIKTGLISRETIIKGYRYYLGIQQVLCLGSDDSTAERVRLLRVWIADKLVIDETGGGGTPITHNTTFEIDEPDLFGGEEFGQGGVVGTLRFFAGTNDQEPSPYLTGQGVRSATVDAGGTGYTLGDVVTEAGSGTASSRATFRVAAVSFGGAGIVTRVQRVQGGIYAAPSSSPAATTGGTGTGLTLSLTYAARKQTVDGVTPAYPDICYLVPDIDPVLYGTSTTIQPWKFEAQRLPNGLGLTGGEENVDGGANPANVVYEILTNEDWGYAIDPLLIDDTNLQAAAATLATEGNGFSFLLDTTEELPALVRRIEEQVDGIVFRDPVDALWKFKLIRADFDIETVPEVNATNLVKLRNFNRGTWEGTSNQVRVPFNDAGDSYKETYGFAQDMANVRILGANVSSEVRHPGVKTAALANAIAWRELRTLSIPLANVELVVDRTLYGVTPGDVIAFTDEDIGFVRLPLRVKSVDYGDLLEGRIVIEAVQDVFYSAAGTFGDPPNTQWEAPGATLEDYPIDERVVMEAPRALTLRDPDSSSPYVDKVFAAARRQGTEVTFQIWERNSAGTPAGAFSLAGEVFGFQLVGSLAAALPLGATNPLSTLQITPVPDTQAALLAAIDTVTNVVDLGTDLVNLLLVGGEFLLVSSAQSNASNVQLNNVYRGVLDSVQQDHEAGALVYLLGAGAGMSDTAIPAGNNADIKLLPRAAGELFAIADATETELVFSNRTRSPYPPAAFDLNGVELDTTNVDLDGSGSGEDVGVLIDTIIRRDYRTVDEVAALGTDAAAIFSDFPTANGTTIDVHVVNPDDDAEAFLVTAQSGTSYTVRQLDILEGLDDVSLPSSLTFGVRQRHDHEGTTYTSYTWLDVTATIASALVGEHAFGALAASAVSTAYVVQVGDSTTDHVLTLSTAFSAGNVEYRINAGSWVTLVTAGGTSGSVPNASLAEADTIEIRHLSPDVGAQKLGTLTVGASVRAYGVLLT